MDVELAFAKALPGISCRIPPPAKVGQEIEDRGPSSVVKEKFTDQAHPSEDETPGRQNGHQAPLFVVIFLFIP